MLLISIDITVVLPFIRVLKNQRPITRTRPMSILTLESGFQVVEPPYTGTSTLFLQCSPRTTLPAEGKQIIDTQAPLSLPGKYIFLFGTNRYQSRRVQKRTKLYFRIYCRSIWSATRQRVRLFPITLACKELLRSICSVLRQGRAIAFTGQRFSRDPRTQLFSFLRFSGTHFTHGTRRLKSYFAISILS